MRIYGLAVYLKFMILCIFTCIYNVHAYRLYMYFSLWCAQNVVFSGSMWAILTGASQIMCWERWASLWRKRSLWVPVCCIITSRWHLQLSFLRNASLMSQRDHRTSLSCIQFRASAAQSSSWPWPLAGLCSSIAWPWLTEEAVTELWESINWNCKIRKVKTSRTERAELGTLSWGLGTNTDMESKNVREKAKT